MEKKVDNATLMTTRKLEYRKGTSIRTGKPYEFVGTQCTVGNEVHDVTFDINTWDAIAQSACALSKVVLKGVLVVNDDGYVVNADVPEKRYVRGHLTNAELVDIVDGPGSAIAYRRGARLPSSDVLKARAEFAAGDADDLADA